MTIALQFGAPVLAAMLVAAPAAHGAGIADSWAGVHWGDSSGALLARFGTRARPLLLPIDFGDSYSNLVLRDVTIGGAPLIAFFQMEKSTGGLKRLQLERPRHGVNPLAARAVVAALYAEFGPPDTACDVGPRPGNGYQAAAERLWRRDDVTVRAIFRDTTIEAFEGCLDRDLSAGPCGLTGQLLVRISPPGADTTSCAAPVPPR